jgi:DNA repair exonuclease SbcCD ATPase subunit
LEEEKQQLESVIQAMQNDSSPRGEEPDEPIRKADADRLSQLEASNSKLEEEIRELKDEARESDEAMEAHAKQHMKDYGKPAGMMLASLNASSGKVRNVANRSSRRLRAKHQKDLAALASQHQKDLAALVSQHKDLGAAVNRGVGRLDPEAQKLFASRWHSFHSNPSTLEFTHELRTCMSRTSPKSINVKSVGIRSSVVPVTLPSAPQ